MGNKWGITPEQAGVLIELERIVGKPILVVDKVKLFTVGVLIKNENVIEMGLHYCKLTTLPDSISILESLQSLNLSSNEFTTLPEPLLALDYSTH